MVIKGNDRIICMDDYTPCIGIGALWGILVRSTTVNMIIPRIIQWPYDEAKYFLQCVAGGVRFATYCTDENDVMTSLWFAQISTYLGSNLSRFFDALVLKELKLYNLFINLIRQQGVRMNFGDCDGITNALFMECFERFYLVSPTVLSDFEQINFVHQRCNALFCDQGPMKLLNEYVGALCESFFKLFAITIGSNRIECLDVVQDGLMNGDWSDYFRNPNFQENADSIRNSVKNAFKCFIDIDTEKCLEKYLESGVKKTFYNSLNELECITFK